MRSRAFALAIACAATLGLALGASGASGGSPAAFANGKIAFAADRGPGIESGIWNVSGPPPPPPPPPPAPRYWDIYVQNEDGTEVQRLTHSGAGFTGRPAWSRDGTRIAFVSDRESRLYDSDIYVMNADGSGQTNLTHNDSVNDEPDWSPNGQIAFQSDRGGNFDVYVMNADGSGLHQVTFDPAYDGRPSWSPDGTRIVFESRRDGNYDLYVLDLATFNVTRLTDDPPFEGWPAWSPDGSSIAFTSNPYGHYDIFVMSANGSGARQVTSGPSWAFNPAWSPDGRKIVFDDNLFDIYVVNADGTGLRNLTNSETLEAAPSWQPIPTGPPPPPVVDRACRVPRVVGLRLATARGRIRRAHCTVGRVRRTRSRRVGRVVRQSPRAGTRLRPGGRVNLVVGRR